jgi:hypothetical protein
MSLLHQITVDQLQRITSIENNAIYTDADKKIGIIAVVEELPIAKVMQRTISEVNKRYAEIKRASQDLPTLQAKRTIRVGAKWYRFEWFIDEITAWSCLATT